MTKPIKQVLDKVILVQIDAHIWTGRGRLKKEDLKNVTESDLPPKELASLGSKKKIDTEHLNIFDTLKKRAHRACEAVGVRFLGGYGVPVSKASDLAKELDAISSEYQSEKAQFLANYQSYVNEWIAAHPEWAHSLTNVLTPIEHVDAAISFDWQAIQIREVQDEDSAVLSRGLDKEVTGLSDRLFIEIGKEAKDMLEKSMFGKEKVTQKALNRVRTLRDKLHDLSFLDANVDPLVASMDYTLSLLPAVGHIEGMHYSALYGLLSLLTDPARAKAHGQAINSGQSVEEAVSESIMSQVPLTSDEADVALSATDDAAAPVTAPLAPVDAPDNAGTTQTQVSPPVFTPAAPKGMPDMAEEDNEICLF